MFIAPFVWSDAMGKVSKKNAEYLSFGIESFVYTIKTWRDVFHVEVDEKQSKIIKYSSKQPTNRLNQFSFQWKKTFINMNLSTPLLAQGKKILTLWK